MVDCCFGGFSEFCFLLFMFLYIFFFSDFRFGYKICFGEWDISKYDVGSDLLSFCVLWFVFLECFFMEVNFDVI